MTKSVENNPNSVFPNPICGATFQECAIAPDRYGDTQNCEERLDLSIVCSIPVDNTDAPGSVKAKKAIDRFIALREEQGLTDEKTTKAFLKAMLHHRRSLGEAPFDNGLNLNIDTVKEVFNSYLEDPDNDFLALFRLNERVGEISKEIFDQANVVFAPANIEMEVVSFETDPSKMPNRHSEGERFFKFLIGGPEGKMIIETPLQQIMIYNKAGDKFDPAVWAMAEAFIARSKATLIDFPNHGHYYELPKSDRDQPMRKFGREQIIPITEESSHDLKRHAKGTQRLIVQENFWSTYMIKRMGSWEGYVLEAASSMHRHGDLPETWKTTLKDKVDLPFIQRMPNEILSKIVFRIAVDNNTGIADLDKTRIAFKRFVSFQEAFRKTQKSEFLNDERTTEEFLKGVLHYRRHLGLSGVIENEKITEEFLKEVIEDRRSRDIPVPDGNLNLDLEIIKKVFCSYLENPDADLLAVLKSNGISCSSIGWGL